VKKGRPAGPGGIVTGARYGGKTTPASASGCSRPPRMRKPRSNRARERRIDQEIVVDAYTSDERAMGWYYYLEGKLDFPFKAKCIAERVVSPLRKSEEVEVLGMAPEEDCIGGMLVLVRFAGRKLGVPLEQLAPVGVDDSTREAIEDWRYWTALGYQF
jgi:hypothetical protein